MRVIQPNRVAVGTLSLIAAGAIGGGVALGLSVGSESPQPVELRQVVETATAEPTTAAASTTTTAASPSSTTTAAPVATRAPQPVAPKVHTTTAEPEPAAPAPAPEPQPEAPAPPATLAPPPVTPTAVYTIRPTTAPTK